MKADQEEVSTEVLGVGKGQLGGWGLCSSRAGELEPTYVREAASWSLQRPEQVYTAHGHCPG